MLSVMSLSSVFANLTLKRCLLSTKTPASHYHQFVIFQIKPRYYSRKRNQTGTYGPFKIVKADHLCDDSSNLNHVNNINWELFATNGYPFYMRGNVGPAWQNTETSESSVQIVSSTVSNQQPVFKIHHSSSSTDQNHQTNQLKQHKKKKRNKNGIKANKNNSKEETTQCVTDLIDLENTKDIKLKKTNNKLTCIINECPMVLRKGVVELFGNTNGGRLIDIKSSILTCITLVQYPKNIYQNQSHQSSSSVNTNTEFNIEHDDDIIEKLAKNFVLAAQDICMTLTIMGYWADFINPFSGKPYFSSQSPPPAYTTQSSFSTGGSPASTTTMYNTDQRFRCLDFQIVKQNNCTIIKNDKQHEYSSNSSPAAAAAAIVDDVTTMKTTQQCDETTTMNIDEISRPMCEDQGTTIDAVNHDNDTFIGNLFTNAPHNIGYLLDITTQRGEEDGESN